MSESTSHEFLLCSECFSNEGLKRDAFKIGSVHDSICPNCDSIWGNKLTADQLENLCYSFFIRGSTSKSDYGSASLFQFNDFHYHKTDLQIPKWLDEDIKLIEKICKLRFFYNTPKTWMIGEITPLNSLKNHTERASVIEQIFEKYPIKELTKNDYFYKLRKNPNVPDSFVEYDSPPIENLGNNRFDSINLPILYGSPDLEICIHECRTTVEDNLYVAKLVPTQNLKVLNLTTNIEENDITEFESLDYSIQLLFLAGQHSYEICRDIAVYVQKKGLDGIIYPSYFKHFRKGEDKFENGVVASPRFFPSAYDPDNFKLIQNIALFGRPIQEKKIEVECINKLRINQISYDFSFGPALKND